MKAALTKNYKIYVSKQLRNVQMFINAENFRNRIRENLLFYVRKYILTQLWSSLYLKNYPNICICLAKLVLLFVSEN